MAVQCHSNVVLPQKFEKLSFKYESQTSVDSAMSSCSSTPSTPTSPIDYEIKVATESDRQAVLEFLRKFFFKDEPLNSCSKLISQEKPICLDIEKFSMKDFNNGLNLLAVYNNNIIGLCLNSILERNPSDDEPFISEDKTFDKIVKLLDYVGEHSDPFRKFPECDRAMTVKILSVDGAYRGKGIAKELIAKTRELAKENGCGFMTVDCTSHFTACALKRLGFQLHWSLDYADYKVNGEVVFNPAPPHKAVTVYTQKIE